MSGTALVRLAMTTFGIALAVSLLLPAASIGHVINMFEGRQAAVKVISEAVSGVDPLLVRHWSLDFHGHQIHPKVIAATGPDSPVPPGLDRLPAPGEVMVSPEVRRLLDSPDGAALRNRIPGTVVGVIGRSGIPDPGDKVMFIGARPEQLAGDQKPEEVYGYGAERDGFGGSIIIVSMLAPAAVVLVLPLLIFVTTASRMGAAQRERRLAALRLIGLDARQVRRVAAGESLVGAAAGLIVGVGFFLVLREWIDDINLFGLRAYGEDFVPSWPLALLIALLIPTLAVGSSLVSLRRIIIEPLGVVRVGRPPRRRMAWRWAITALGAAMLISTLFAEKGSGNPAVTAALTIGSALSLLGMAAVLPWLVEQLVRRMSGGAPSWQLAIRRLQLEAGTASRVVSGLVVALAGSILIQALIISLSPTVTETQPFTRGPASVRVSAEHAVIDEVQHRLKAVPGITEITVLRRTVVTGADISMEVGDCAALKLRAKLPDCTDGAVYYLEPDPDSGVDTPVVPSGVLQLSDSYSGTPTRTLRWTVPDGIRRVPAVDGSRGGGGLLVTPAALRDASLPVAVADIHVAGAGAADELADRVGAALSPLSWQTRVSTISGSDSLAEEQALTRRVRALLLAASVFVLSVAGLSLLLLSAEQITERRRPLAALSAAGVPISVLAKGLLWQTAVPVGVGVLLAVATGIGISAPILRMADVPISFDVGGIANLVVTMILTILTVTALALPLLRSITRLDSLRSE